MDWSVGEEILAVLGAIVGLLGGMAGLSTYIRSRRSVRVHSIPSFGSAGSLLRITVVNPRSEPITLVDIGWAVVPEPSRFLSWLRLFCYPLFVRRMQKWHTDHPRYGVLGEDVDTGPIAVELTHGQVHNVDVSLDWIGGSVGEGRVAWPMAEDSLNRLWFADGPASV